MATYWNPKNYTPAQDSSPHTDPNTEVVMIFRKVGRGKSATATCFCGCGMTTPNIEAGKSSFCQGHDARFKGVLIRAYLTSTDLNIDGFVITAVDEAKRLGWLKVLVEAKARFEGRPRPRQTAANVNGPQLGGSARVKVGRWEYDGTVVAIEGDHAVIEYHSKKGDAKRAERPLSTF